MATFNNKAGYLGSLLTESGQVGGGQAVLTPFVDPTYVFMSAALLNLEKKLDDIKEMQTEILDFLKQKEKADLRGNLKTLFDILENYKFNWNNEKYKTNKHILVQDIRRDAEKSIIFYSERIENRLKKKNVLPSDQEVKSLLQKLEEDFQEYQLSLYVYAFSSFWKSCCWKILIQSIFPACLKRLRGTPYGIESCIRPAIIKQKGSPLLLCRPGCSKD